MRGEMPAKNFLKPEQQEKLQKALKKEENGEIRERILMLLLLKLRFPMRDTIAWNQWNFNLCSNGSFNAEAFGF